MKRAIIMAAGALALTGCGGTPDCGSEEALGLVTDIFYREAAKKIAALGRSEGRSEIAEAMQIKPTLVKMTDYNDRTDTYSCSATLTGKNSTARVMRHK